MQMRTLIAIASLSLASLSFAWGDIGHGVITKIAYANLTPTARTRFDELLKIGVAARFQNLAMVGNWADDVRTDTDGPWHYINIHFRTDGKPVTTKALDENVVWAISRFKSRLADKKALPSQRAEALRYLVHFVGDVHQPLHNVARDTDAFPTGDRGGNDFAIKPGNGLPDWNTNLHRVWDSGCGAFAAPMRAWEPGADAVMETLAKSVAAEYSKSTLKVRAQNLDANRWSQEGFKIAKETAYKTTDGGTPSLDYVSKGQKICRERVALAGYRLANILNKAFGS